MGNINLLLVFMEGVFSLFSPCVLPLIPIYLGIMANSSVQSLKDGEVKFLNSTLFRNTVLFVLGISVTFFILGSSISLLSKFLISNKQVILIVGGILIIIMGIFYMGYIDIPILQREKRMNIEIKEMTPLTAFLFGFVFSFGWTPCIGPMLSSVLIMASASNSVLYGNILILIYTMGFTVPFIIIAIFYEKLYKHIDKMKVHLDLIKKIGGAILIMSGIIMLLGGTDKTLEYIKKVIPYNVENREVQDNKEQQSSESNDNKQDNSGQDNGQQSNLKQQKIKAPNFSLVDQYGNTQNLSSYQGKVVFLNFWATWCPPCKEELPSIDQISKEYSNDDVVILGVTGPNMGREGSEKDIKDFMSKNGYTFKVAFDTTGEVMEDYSINAFPTTFIIDKDGYIRQYVPGAMDKKTMKYLIDSSIQK
jgi:cytochrome c-type biogenesis protein